MIKSSDLFRNAHTIVLLIVALVVAFYVACGYYVPCSIHSDSGWGLVVLRSMQNGAEFNCYKLPDPRNILVDNGLQFLTAWTPAQYLVPGLFIWLLHFKVGTALLLTVVLCSVLGLIGFYKLYLLLGFSKLVASVSLLLIAFQRYFSVQFTIYSGGEMVLFAGLPWIIIGFIRRRKLLFPDIVLLVLFSIFGFILKASFLISLVSLCLFLLLAKVFLNEEGQLKPVGLRSVFSKKKLIYSFKLVVVFICTYFLIYFFFLSKGFNPSGSGQIRSDLFGFLFPLSSAIASCFSIDDFVNKMVSFPGYATFSTATTSIDPVFVYLPLAILNLFSIFYLLKKSPSGIFTLLFISCNIVFILYFINMYNHICHGGGSWSYVMRYFRMLGLLFMPLVVHAFFTLNKLKQAVVVLFVAVLSLYGISSFIHRRAFMRDNMSLGREYFYMDIDRPVLDYIHATDDSLVTGNNIFYLTSPEMVLEIKHNRVIPVHADFNPLEKLAATRYYGKVDRLYLVLPKKFELNGKAKAIENSFVAYSVFSKVCESEKWEVILAE